MSVEWSVKGIINITNDAVILKEKFTRRRSKKYICYLYGFLAKKQGKV
jgi:hypothetical protein